MRTTPDKAGQIGFYLLRIVKEAAFALVHRQDIFSLLVLPVDINFSKILKGFVRINSISYFLTLVTFKIWFISHSFYQFCWYRLIFLSFRLFKNCFFCHIPVMSLYFCHIHVIPVDIFSKMSKDFIKDKFNNNKFIII